MSISCVNMYEKKTFDFLADFTCEITRIPENVHLRIMYSTAHVRGENPAVAVAIWECHSAAQPSIRCSTSASALSRALPESKSLKDRNGASLAAPEGFSSMRSMSDRSPAA